MKTIHFEDCSRKLARYRSKKAVEIINRETDKRSAMDIIADLSVVIAILALIRISLEI